MPAWKAGKQNGKTVRVDFTLPIKFILENTSNDKENVKVGNGIEIFGNDNQNISDALILVNGKEITYGEFKKIDPSKIISMDVKKGNQTTLYGKKAKKGVIMILTKAD